MQETQKGEILSRLTWVDGMWHSTLLKSHWKASACRICNQILWVNDIRLIQDAFLTVDHQNLPLNLEKKNQSFLLLLRPQDQPFTCKAE